MASLEIATKANPAVVLPTVVLACYLQQTEQLPAITKSFQDALARRESVRLTVDGSKTLIDWAVILYFAEITNKEASSQRASSIQEWVKRSESFAITDFRDLRKHLDELNNHLTLRTHIVGYNLSVADLAVWATIRGNRVAHASIKKTTNNISRWCNYIETSNPWILETAAELTTYASKEQASLSAAGASYEIDLPKMDGPMVTRFPPEPSGYLHIGHAKAALLNDYFAHQHLGGTLLCRFDDTNPSKESMEFQDAILHDLQLMEITPEIITHSSDYFQEMYEYALKLIKDGKAFADDSELGKGDKDRKNRLPSKRRDLSIENTLAYFAEMKTGSKEGQRWCLRARIAYDSPNGTLRDPVIYRCNLTPHHRTGTEWMIYPTYDFCAPILDSIEGVTLALRTNEYRDRNVQYEWMQDALGLRKVTIWDFSRLNFIRTVLSKRKLTKIVNNGKVWGWDDPRMPTIRGILRRGLAVPVLREYVLKQGPSKHVLNLEWGAIWSINKKHIDPECPRHTAIAQEQAVYCRVFGIDSYQETAKPKYIKNLSLGSKKVIYSKTIVLEQSDVQMFKLGEEITLMNWGNAYVRSIIKDPTTESIITGIDLELHLDGDFKKPKKISWLAAVDGNLIPVDLVTFDHLLSKDKLEKHDELEEFLTPITEFRSQAWADCNVAELLRGAVLQFERKGYYKLDVPYQGDGEGRMVLFEIPTGRT